MNKKLLQIGGLVIAFFPMAITILTYLFAGLVGCSVNEAGYSACRIGGVDFGNTMYHFGMYGWFTFVTMPIGLVIWLVGFFMKNENVIVSSPNDGKFNTAKTLIVVGILVVMFGSLFVSIFESFLLLIVGEFFGRLIVAFPLGFLVHLFGFILLLVGIAKFVKAKRSI
ncbi:MAG: hypothetical protein WCJ25_03820 [Candidatus Moraniibacteriota bacterium]